MARSMTTKSSTDTPEQPAPERQAPLLQVGDEGQMVQQRPDPDRTRTLVEAHRPTPRSDVVTHAHLVAVVPDDRRQAGELLERISLGIVRARRVVGNPVADRKPSQPRVTAVVSLHESAGPPCEHVSA